LMVPVVMRTSTLPEQSVAERTVRSRRGDHAKLHHEL
jgi:hypothetical protein